MSGIKLRVQIKGYQALATKLTRDHILGQVWTRALTDAAEKVEGVAKQRAPVRSGALRASITHRFQKKPVPMWAAVTAKATRKTFRYGFALNFSSKKRIFHYRSGGPVGQKTLHWFTAVLNETKIVQQMVEQAAAQIEARFNGHAG